MSAARSLPPRTAGVSELLDAASRIWRATLPKCLPLAMLAILSAYLPALYLNVTGQPLPKWPELPRDPLYWVCYAVAMLAYLLLGSVAILRQRERALADKCHAGLAWRTALRRLPALFATIVLCQLLVGFGLLLLLVPGVYIAVCLFVIWCVVLFEPLGPGAAVVRSIRLVHPLWWKHCAAIVLALLILAVSVFTALILTALLQAVLVPVGSALGNALAVASGIAYFAAALLFVTALAIVLYSAASSSA
ncbi:MAG: hypothetical protein IT480_05090 [Gammaproteobacteria bacterium]|nr:hypothetical protein [Gammaproteobacteria bacterium]